MSNPEPLRAPVVRTLVGQVVSNKMQKTLVVMVERTVAHPKYGKIMRKRSRLQVHDEAQVGKMGDRVRIRETRPLSRHKNWILDTIL